MEDELNKSNDAAERIKIVGDKLSSNEFRKKFFQKYTYFPFLTSFSQKKYSIQEIDKEESKKHSVPYHLGVKLIHLNVFNAWYNHALSQRPNNIIITGESFIDFTDENKFKIILNFYQIAKHEINKRQLPLGVSFLDWIENIGGVEVVRRTIENPMPKSMYSTNELDFENKKGNHNFLQNMSKD